MRIATNFARETRGFFCDERYTRRTTRKSYDSARMCQKGFASWNET